MNRIERSTKARAIQLLGRREHGREELRRKLIQRGCDVEEVTAVLDECAAAGWQNDRRYAEEYAQRRAERGYGPQMIRYELEQRGLDSELISAALTLMAETCVEQLQQLINKRCPHGVPADARQRASLMRFLQGRGHEPEQIRLALKNRTAD